MRNCKAVGKIISYIRNFILETPANIFNISFSDKIIWLCCCSLNRKLPYLISADDGNLYCDI